FALPVVAGQAIVRDETAHDRDLLGAELGEHQADFVAEEAASTAPSDARGAAHVAMRVTDLERDDALAWRRSRAHERALRREVNDGAHAARERAINDMTLAAAGIARLNVLEALGTHARSIGWLSRGVHRELQQ